MSFYTYQRLSLASHPHCRPPMVCKCVCVCPPGKPTIDTQLSTVLIQGLQGRGGGITVHHNIPRAPTRDTSVDVKTNQSSVILQDLNLFIFFKFPASDVCFTRTVVSAM